MTYLILSVLCYLATSVTMKLAAVRGLDAIEVNLSLRVSGTVLTIVLLVITAASLTQPQLPQATALGVFSGLCTFLSGYYSLRALDFGPLNTTWSVLRMATVIPVLASILVWGELRSATEPHEIVTKLAGVACLLVALTLLGRGQHE